MVSIGSVTDWSGYGFDPDSSLVYYSTCYYSGFSWWRSANRAITASDRTTIEGGGGRGVRRGYWSISRWWRAYLTGMGGIIAV